jgi:hypothetical protein
MNTISNTIRLQAVRERQAISLSRIFDRAGTLPSKPTIICRDISLSPFSRDLIRKHVDALGRFGVWPWRLTIVVEALSPAGCGVMVHVIVAGAGLELSAMRKSAEGPCSYDLRIAIRCCFVAIEAELMCRTGLHP